MTLPLSSCCLFVPLTRSCCCSSLSLCACQGPQLRYAFSELDLADAEELALHVRLEQDANGNQLPTMRMTTKSDAGEHKSQSWCARSSTCVSCAVQRTFAARLTMSCAF
jgi:hypothetical protein